MADSVAETVQEVVNATLDSAAGDGDPDGFAGQALAYVALLLMALGPIWFGSHRSVRDDKNEEKREETIKSSDAAMFPIIASCALFGVYILFKVLGKEYINFLLGGYFFLLGVASLTGSFRPLGVYLLPVSLTEQPFNLHMKQQQKELTEAEQAEAARIAEEKRATEAERAAKIATAKEEGGLPVQAYYFVLEQLGIENDPSAEPVPEDTSGMVFDLNFDYVDLACAACACVVGAWYLYTKHWLANNLFGLSFSLTGVSLVPLNNYKTGCILLGGLFFYDVFWVFGTDVMVTVAKSFDAPIKVLFPKDFMAHGVFATQHAMLGLGDIVLPGIFIALMLRFDKSRSPGGKVYFLATFIAYILGLVTTIVVMHSFNAAQPALLYLSPACTLAPLLVSLVRGEFSALLAYEDDAAPAAKEAGKDE